MGDDAIFFKTLAGDEAVRERTRLVQRNLRMVLILVDGFADVAELKRKVGDPSIVESSLVELERLGLVESIDTRMARNKEAALVVSSPEPLSFEALDAPLDVATAPASDFDDAPLLTEAVTPMPPPREAPLTDALTVFDEDAASKSWMIPGFNVPLAEEKTEPPAPTPSPLARVTAWWDRLRESREQAKEDAIYEKAYGRSEPEVASFSPSVISEPAPPPMPEELPPESVKIKPIRRPRPSRSFVQRLVMAVLVIILAGLLLLVFFPYGNYRPDFEARLTSILGEPVTIANVEVAFTPYPAVTLSGVEIGSPVYASVGSIYLLPEPISLLGMHHYRQVLVSGVSMKEGGLPRISRWLTPGSLGEIAISQLVFEGATLDLGGRSLSGLNGRIQLVGERALGSIEVGTEGEAFHLSMTPTQDGLSWVLSARDWKLQSDPELPFDRVEARGRMSPGLLSIDKLEGLLFDGAIAGTGELAWTGDANLAMNLDFERLDAARLMALFRGEPGLEGRLTGKLKLMARAGSFSALAGTAQLEGTFQVEQGNLKRIDLAQALRAVGKLEPVTGGATRFEDFSGAFAIDDKAVRLSRLRLHSGLMSAFGQVAVMRGGGAISGGGIAEMRGSATTVRANLSLSGKAADPAIKAGN